MWTRTSVVLIVLALFGCLASPKQEPVLTYYDRYGYVSACVWTICSEPEVLDPELGWMCPVPPEYWVLLPTRYWKGDRQRLRCDW